MIQLDEEGGERRWRERRLRRKERGKWMGKAKKWDSQQITGKIALYPSLHFGCCLHSDEPVGLL